MHPCLVTAGIGNPQVVLHGLTIILKIVLPNSFIVVFAQDGAMTINLMIVELNTLCIILTIVVLNGLLAS